jgi:hypothetical protein
MDIDRLSSIASRTFFAVAFILLGLAIVERAAYVFEYTILRGTFTAGRLLELAVVVMVFVIALLLRQIREHLRSGATTGS